MQNVGGNSVKVFLMSSGHTGYIQDYMERKRKLNNKRTIYRRSRESHP